MSESISKSALDDVKLVGWIPPDSTTTHFGYLLLEMRRDLGNNIADIAAKCGIGTAPTGWKRK